MDRWISVMCNMGRIGVPNSMNESYTLEPCRVLDTHNIDPIGRKQVGYIPATDPIRTRPVYMDALGPRKDLIPSAVDSPFPSHWPPPLDKNHRKNPRLLFLTSKSYLFYAHWLHLLLISQALFPLSRPLKTLPKVTKPHYPLPIFFPSSLFFCSFLLMGLLGWEESRGGETRWMNMWAWTVFSTSKWPTWEITCLEFNSCFMLYI